MPKIVIKDGFYPGISLHRNLRRTPDSVIRLHRTILEANGYAVSNKNLATILSASRALYVFLSTESEAEMNDYRAEIEGRRPIKGAVVLQIDLVIQILSSIMKYLSEHPGEAIQTAAALAYLEERLEKKVGKVGKRIWRKVWARRSTASPKRQVVRLAKIPKRRVKTHGTRGSSNRIRRKKKTFQQLKLD